MTIATSVADSGAGLTAVDIVRRPPRLAPPALLDGDVVLGTPPRVPTAQGGAASWLQYTFPAVGSLGAILFVLINPKPLFIASGLIFALSSIAMGVGLALQQRTSQGRTLAAERSRYLAHLTELRHAAIDTAARQREAAAWTNPRPEQLWTLVRGRSRLWERRRDDADALAVRAGAGRRPLATPLILELAPGSTADVDPLSVAEARDLVARYGILEGLPLTVDIGGGGAISVRGGEPARAMLRAMVAQLVTLHAPDDLRIAVCVGVAEAPAWEWTKWLPHCQHPTEVDGAGPARMSESDVVRLLTMLGDELSTRAAGARGQGTEARPPHLLIVVDGGSSLSVLPEVAAAPGVTVALLASSDLDEVTLGSTARLRLEVDGRGRLAVTELGPNGGPRGEGVPDALSVMRSQSLARLLAPLRLSAEERSPVTTEGVDLSRLLGIGDISGFDPAETWRRRRAGELLRLPIGVSPSGEPVDLDLKESAQGGMGPHGLVVGATGAGKSELLRTLVTGLAIGHPPELLSFVLVDFKGGATFAGLADLPHVAGMITNLSDDLALVDRVKDALFGEQNRRQELLRSAGNLASIRDYHERRAAGAQLEPMPFLVVVVDEFGQLLAARPDFIELFVSVGRLGRSLGMHLVLASQQLDEGRLRGLEGHISYRLCLRTFSAAESRVVLGVPDAYNLPPLPGSGYLKVDTTIFERFRAALVSAPYRRPAADRVPTTPHPRPFTAAPVPIDGPRPEVRRGGEQAATPTDAVAVAVTSAEPAATAMELAVEQMRDAAPRAHQVWLPPLEPTLSLDQLLPGIALDGVAAAVRSWPGSGRLSVPIGLIDRPLEQAREVLAVDLAGSAGHLAVVGAPQTGKSTLLRTLVLATALTHSPREVWFHAIDYGGGGLEQVAALPHVGTVCGRLDPERVRRVVSHVSSMIEEREQLFRSRGIDSVATLRMTRAGGAMPAELSADVVLLIDNWPAVRLEHEDLEPLVTDIAGRGLGFGVHLVLTANRWMDLRSALRDSIGGRLELRLNDPTESDVDRRTAANVPDDVPGRGLTRDRLLFQAALPRLDGHPVRDDLAGATETAVAAASSLWPVAGEAPPVRVLPTLLPFTELPTPVRDPGTAVPVGVAEPDLRPFRLDLLGGEPHFVVYGDSETGKTSLLRTYLAGLAARVSPERARVVLVDYRMRLREAVPTAHLHAYAGTPTAAADALLELRGLIEGRMPGADLSARELRERSWWSGPDVIVVVDDYDLVSTPSGNPLLPLVDVLAQGQDLGFHLLVTRRVGGASRALFEPPLQRLRELGAPGLILSGDRQEGALVGPFAATPRPPGRGLMVQRHQRPTMVQLAWLPAHEGEG